MSGTTAIVGAEGHAKNAGRAYVFTKTGAVWRQTAELKGSDTVANDFFGASVGVSGTTAVVGAPELAENAGRAYVFTKAATSWKQVTELKGSDTAVGDTFGNSVAVSSTIAIVGAEDHAKGAGRSYVFTKAGGVWKQTAELKGSDTVANDFFGSSVAISDTTTVVGASNADSAGRAYVFTKTAPGWKQVAELKGSDTVYADEFGASVGVSGTTAVVGAYFHALSGHAYLFTKTGSVWKQVAELKAPTACLAMPIYSATR